MKKQKDAMVSSGLLIQTYTGAANKPTVTFNAGTGRYDALCCALSFGGNNYNAAAGGVDNKSCIFAKGILSGDLINVSTPTGINPEPVDLFSATDMDFDGTEDIDILLIFNPLFTTVICSASNTAALSVELTGMGLTIDATILSAFTANGAGNDYTLDEAAITTVSATLWGGDGAGGERTATGFIAGDIIFTRTMTADCQPFGISGEFAAGGADKRLLCYLNVDGVRVFSFSLPDGISQNIKIPGRIHALTGQVVTITVAADNANGGTVKTAIITGA